jgi:putative copper resistance protein D
MLLLAGGLAYGFGVRRLARRGRRWRRSRSAAFAAGLVVLGAATMSPLGTCEDRRLALHALQHTSLALVGPLLIALGAPLTLALQAVTRSTRSRLLGVLHRRPVEVLAHPIVAATVFSLSVFALYLTPWLEASLTNSAVHALTHLHMAVAGLVLVASLVVVDPMPSPAGFPLRLLIATLMIPLHGIVGVTLSSTTTPVAPTFYGLADQQVGGAVLWLAGDVGGLVLLGVVVARWLGHELRADARELALGTFDSAVGPDDPSPRTARQRTMTSVGNRSRQEDRHD